MKFDSGNITARIRDGLQSAANRVEGGFSMDNVQAVANEMAKLYSMEILPIPDNFSLETAYGDYLDRKGFDLWEPRKDGEEDEAYRKRLLFKVQKPITSGNENHYVYWAKQVDGVGNAKCIGCWAGAGTVKVVILSDTSDVPGSHTLQAVREHIAVNRPVGADVTVSPAVPVALNIDATLRLAAGYKPEEMQVSIAAAITEYLTGIAFEDNSSLSHYRVGELMFHVDGVEDVVKYTVNGSAEAVPIGADEFLRLGEVVIHAAE